MNTHLNRWMLCLLLAAAGCASTPDGKDAGPAPEPTAAQPAPKSSFPRITFSQEAATLGETARRIGEAAGGGLVIMAGLQEVAVPPFSVDNKPLGEVAAQLAETVQFSLDAQPHYFFIYPESYAALLGLSLQGRLPGRYADARAKLTIGGGTALYNVLGLLSYTLGMTLVADNAVAEAFTGEMSLPEAPLPEVLEAVLRSALVNPVLFNVEADDQYVFFYSGRPHPKGPFLLNPGGGSEAIRARLALPADFVLPKPPDGKGFLFPTGPARLETALLSLSAQLDVHIEAEDALADLPVNPCVMRGISLGVALDLLLRQWPVSGFGYEVTKDSILIRRTAGK